MHENDIKYLYLMQRISSGICKVLFNDKDNFFLKRKHNIEYFIFQGKKKKALPNDLFTQYENFKLFYNLTRLLL